MLREYIEAMRALWTQEEAEYDGEFVKFGPSWAWPKPVQSHIPVLVGAGGTEKTFKRIARSADGWITTPRDFDIDAPVKLLQDIWADAGRDGAPQIVALDFKPVPEKLAHWRELGVTEVLFGLPDKSADEVAAYVERLAGKLAAITRPVARLMPSSPDFTVMARPTGRRRSSGSPDPGRWPGPWNRLPSASRRPMMTPVRSGQS